MILPKYFIVTAHGDNRVEQLEEAAKKLVKAGFELTNFSSFDLKKKQKSNFNIVVGFCPYNSERIMFDESGKDYTPGESYKFGTDNAKNFYEKAVTFNATELPGILRVVLLGGQGQPSSSIENTAIEAVNLTSKVSSINKKVTNIINLLKKNEKNKKGKERKSSSRA